jgi:hypothetical protein
MNPEEYQNLASIETIHWFYAGKRKIVRLIRSAPRNYGLRLFGVAESSRHKVNPLNVQTGRFRRKYLIVKGFLGGNFKADAAQ